MTTKVTSELGKGHPSMMNSSGPLGCGMDNVLAFKLGAIALEAGSRERSDIGDNIDRGLVLRRLLQEQGFTLLWDEVA
jgi:hypothetical protein